MITYKVGRRYLNVTVQTVNNKGTDVPGQRLRREDRVVHQRTSVFRLSSRLKRKRIMF